MYSTYKVMYVICLLNKLFMLSTYHSLFKEILAVKERCVDFTVALRYKLHLQVYAINLHVGIIIILILVRLRYASYHKPQAFL